jgi:prepilin-type N-terminal cleavage/methylation domain-containing protein
MRAGFTLVEILIAIAISSIIFLVVISTYSMTLKTLDIWGNTEEDYYLARNIFRRMRSEISSLYYVPEPMNTSAQQERTDYNGLEGHENTFSFYTTAKSLYFPFTCLTKVTYEFIIDDEGKNSFIRTEEPLIDFPDNGDLYLDSRQSNCESYVYSNNLKDFKFQYFNGEDWYDYWNIERAEEILKAVKIEIVSSHGEKFSTIMQIPAGI